MGRDELFAQGIDRVMKRVPGGVEGFRKRYMEAVNAGLNPDLSTFEGIHSAIDYQVWK